MTATIDKLNKGIEERSAKIEDLRRQSVLFLSQTNLNNSESSDEMDICTYLEFENEINRIQKEKSDLELKRNTAISEFQSEILGDEMDNMIPVMPSFVPSALTTPVQQAFTALAEPGESCRGEMASYVSSEGDLSDVDRTNREIIETESVHGDEGICTFSELKLNTDEL